MTYYHLDNSMCRKCETKKTDYGNIRDNFVLFWNTIERGENVEESKRKRPEKEEKEKFNSVTQSVKPENQNQTHNVKKEGLGPLNSRR